MDPSDRSGRHRARDKNKEVMPEPRRKTTGKGKKKVGTSEQHSEPFGGLGVDFPSTQPP